MSDPYHLQDFTTLEMTSSSGSTVAVAGIKDVTIVPQVERDNLYTADATTREAGKQREFSVNVEIGYAKFDGEIVKEWLGGEGANATAWGDSSDPQQFELTATFEATNSDQQITVDVGEIEFDEMPVFDGSQDDFVTWDLSGTGYALTNFDVTTPA